MARYRRGYIALLQEITLTTQHREIGDSYARRMEWIAAAIGCTFAIVGVLLLLGVLDLGFESP